MLPGSSKGGSASLGGPSCCNYPWLYPWQTLPINHRTLLMSLDGASQPMASGHSQMSRGGIPRET